MAAQVTSYKTENGKTVRVEEDGPPAGAPAADGAAGASPGANNKNKQPEIPAKQGA